MLTSKHLTLWLLLSLLAGCTGWNQREATSTGWEEHTRHLKLLQQWTATGKLAVRTTDASESATLVWQQEDRNTYVQLSGPLGMGATTIHSDGQQLNVQRGDEFSTFDISSPEAIALNTGWDIPLHALTHWLKGIPAPDSKVQRLELDPETELLQSLQQDNWEVRYERYGQFQEFTLPTRLQIQRGDTRAKIIISRWQTAPS
jgi:outer membrane lipoprotein LolB